VPVYSVGLPLLMAAAKTLAGQCGLFAVAPLAGGVLVFATYAIGRRIGRPIVGLAAAWLVATSATTLYMTVQPMSDVPAAAAWAVAVALLLGRDIPQTSAACASASTSASSASCVLSGVAAAVAITIRPNLVPLAGVLAVWAACRDARSLCLCVLSCSPYRRAPVPRSSRS
jgi:hypothetical protein